MLKATAFDQRLQYLDIVDFIQHVNKTNQEEQQVLSTSDNGTNKLILHSGPAKPKLETLTITQWSMANMAIMYKLLSTGDLAPIQMLEYLSYTMSIWRFSCTCEWVSVLFFDREYRKLQKQLNFPWGTDVPRLQTEILRQKSLETNPKPLIHSQVQLSKPKQFVTNYASHTSNGIAICKKFNFRKGCFLPQCKFEHVCAVPGCAGKHPAFKHQKN